LKIKFLNRRQDTFNYKIDRACVTCGNEFKGRYCNVCGEKVTELYERSILSFLSGLLNAFTFLDGKFFNTVKLLIVKPGQLSKNIQEGKRVPFMNMLSLFFVANFFYFLFPIFDSYNSTLYSQMYQVGYHSEIAQKTVTAKLDEATIAFKDFEETYNSQSTNLSKSLIIVLVFAFSGILMVMNYSKGSFFFNHLLFALEFYSFQLLLIAFLLANLIRVLVKVAFYFGIDWAFLLSDFTFTSIHVSLIAYFLIRGLITYYRQKWYWAILKSIVLIFLLQGTVITYRIMLFYFTIWTM
jgi:hypothetical protein